MEENKKEKISTARRCLENNYKKLNVNVRKEKYEIWKAYAENKGLSMYALVNELFEKAIEADGFVYEKSEEESAE